MFYKKINSAVLSFICIINQHSQLTWKSLDWYTDDRFDIKAGEVNRSRQCMERTKGNMGMKKKIKKIKIWMMG